MTNDYALRVRCKQLIRTLPIPDPFDEEVFLANLARERNRPIELRPVLLPPGLPCGLLVGTTETDFIVRSAGLSPLHARHVGLHELGHLLLGHRDPDAGDAETAVDSPAAAAVDEDVVAALSLLLPALDPAMIRLMLGRTAYDDEQEREAETFASMLMTEVSHQPSRRRALDLADPLAAVPSPRRGRRTERWLGAWLTI